jgi:two-component system chemotaxis response regulator CheB
MGKDGAAGLLEMKKAGAKTIAQDESSCIVYGMPKVAVEMGGVDEITPLADIPQKIIKMLTESVL